ncbi:class F sortase [Streptomyces actinomycinicus]|uniref:Class F sortase n=1 Tax=Streptomyces actinomycinicus TaxID=1695166 RepID=A0A937EEH0_9ACTN|nr:class F sortase [Streptomyces actinomycinicus]MBL1080659.1 class F sortase [Streptomyces actinomycinicus]
MAPRHRTGTPRDPFLPGVLVVGGALTAGAVLLFSGVHKEEPPRPSAAHALPGPAHPAGPTVRPLPPSEPVRIRIASIGVNAPMTRVGLDAEGALRTPPPEEPGLAGWYGDGTTPGSAGTAVATGHVDTPAGDPGVFYDLGALTEGATIEISRADRRTAVFAVRAVELYDREGFPSEKVYGSSGRPELRLITCGGGYTRRTGYLGNVVVYASLTAVRQR